MEVLIDLLQTFGFSALKAISRNNVILAEIAVKMDIDFPIDEEDVS